MNQFIEIFKKVGGRDILRQYRRAHVLLLALVETMILGFSKKSLEIVRLAVSNRILEKMRKKYKTFISIYKEMIDKSSLCRVHSDKVWVLWLQGIEKAPVLVQKCFHSLQENLVDREIILLTEDNYRNYVAFPDFIQEKIDDGKISRTHMSDLLRLELLINYGGTWIDATVFCSGKSYPKCILDSELFTYQCLKPGLDGHCTCISSWLMTSYTNHPILLLSRALLYEYWKNNNTMVDYFLLHDFFQLSIEVYPDEWNKVIPISNSIPHILLLKLFEQYDEETWDAIKLQTCFHKMTYKFKKEQENFNETYYDILFR